jgi:hypothetical protein
MIEDVFDSTVQDAIKTLTDNTRGADHLRTYFFLVKVLRHPEGFKLSPKSKAAIVAAIENLHDHELQTAGELFYEAWVRDLKAGIASFRDEPK